MIDKLEHAKCVLCGSCVSSCPVNAITFGIKQRDFEYPIIDLNKCIKCNKCEKSCPVLSFDDSHNVINPKAYIGQNIDKSVRIQSTSGGIFSSLAREILSRNGFVCGAILDSCFQVKHILSNREDDIKKMIGSKYANSDLTGVYNEIEQILKQEHEVLFCGCPCQIAAITTFLGKRYEKLYLMELICHGVPSNNLLQSYILLQEKRYNSKIKELCFREKSRGWHNSSVTILFENGRRYSEPITVDAYMRGFLSGVTMKESCYNCLFRDFRAGSDFTFGDFWGAEAEVPHLDDNTGLSAILINSEKGEKLLKKSSIEMWPFEMETIIRYNRNIIESVTKSPVREDFYRYAEENGYEQAIKKYLEEKPMVRIRRLIRWGLRRCKHMLFRKQKTLY